MRKIGVVTIGQSPRSDVVPEISRLVCGANNLREVTFLEKGALDGLASDEITSLSPRAGKDFLVTRLRNGTEVTVDKNLIRPRLGQAISELDREGADVIALLCSGEFAPFHSESPLIIPARLLSGVLSSIFLSGKLGVMVPSEKQVGVATEAYQRLGFSPIGVGASPYGEKEAITGAANRLKEEVALVVMDCFGYDLEMKNQVRKITGTPVILVRSLLAWTLSECIQ